MKIFPRILLPRYLKIRRKKKCLNKKENTFCWLQKDVRERYVFCMIMLIQNLVYKFSIFVIAFNLSFHWPEKRLEKINKASIWIKLNFGITPHSMWKSFRVWDCRKQTHATSLREKLGHSFSVFPFRFPVLWFPRFAIPEFRHVQLKTLSVVLSFVWRKIVFKVW